MSGLLVAGGVEYSTEEKVIGTWIDGKPLYQKTVNCGELPNASVKNVDSGLTNVTITNMYGIAINTAASDSDALVSFPLPRPVMVASADPNRLYGVDITYRKNNKIRFTTGNNWSGYNAYVTLQYTKTTD